MDISLSQLSSVLSALQNAGLTPTTFLIGLLNSGISNSAALDFTSNIPRILDMIYVSHSSTLFPWACKIAFAKCEEEIISVLDKYDHIGAENITGEQLKSINIGTLIINFERRAPSVWKLLGTLLDVQSRAKDLRMQRALAHPTDDADSDGRRDRVLDIVCIILYTILTTA